MYVNASYHPILVSASSLILGDKHTPAGLNKYKKIIIIIIIIEFL